MSRDQATPRRRAPVERPHPGRWALTVVALLGGAAVGCSPLDSAEKTAAPGSSDQANGRSGSPNRPDRPPTPVATRVAETGSIASFYVSTATLEAEKTAPVLARVQGIVRAITHEEGDAVAEGRVLLRIENGEYKLRVEQARARAAQLQNQYERLKGMVKNDLIPVEEFETVQHDLRSAKAEEGLAQLALSRTLVRAPFAGRVTQRLVDVGQTVRDGTPLFVLADLNPLLARVYVPSKEFRKLTPDQPVELVLDSSGEPLAGKVRLVSPVIDPESGTIKITVEIPKYPDETRPGDFAEVRIVTAQHEDAVLVPKIAVIEDREEHVVFVAVAERAERRRVQTGFEEAGRIEIVEGLRAGEVVVTKGQHSLKDGEPVKVIDSTKPAPPNAPEL